MTTAVNPGLKVAVERLQGRVSAQLQAERISQELKNAQDGSEAQLRELQQLRAEFGDQFAEVVALDAFTPGVLKRAGIRIVPQIEMGKAWLAEHARWCEHHEQNLAWIKNPPKDIALEDVVRRIDEGKTAASSLRASAVNLDSELKKLL